MTIEERLAEIEAANAVNDIYSSPNVPKLVAALRRALEAGGEFIPGGIFFDLEQEIAQILSK